MASLLAVLLAFVSGLIAEASAEKHLIVVSLSADAYYNDYMGDIAKFANDLAGKGVQLQHTFSSTVHTLPWSKRGLQT